MAKANINLPNGTVVTVDGTADEINAILSLYQSSEAGLDDNNSKKEKGGKKKKSKANKTGKRSKSKTGPRNYIRELISSQYFKTKRTIKDVQKKLEENGHIYAQSAISEPLLRLVQLSEIRRIKEKDGWMYVNK